MNGKVIHAQGANSYTANVSSYEDSADKAKVFTFVSDSLSGKKIYINGVLAAEGSDTSKLSGITSLPIGKSYSGEIGEVAIFTRALKGEERKAVEEIISGKNSRLKLIAMQLLADVPQEQLLQVVVQKIVLLRKYREYPLLALLQME